MAAGFLYGCLVVDQVVDVMRRDTGAAGKLANLPVDAGADAGRRLTRARAGGRVGGHRHEGNLARRPA